MAVPDFQSFFLPILRLASDGMEHSIQEAREVIAKQMELTAEDLNDLLPSGTQTKFDNRIAWAKSYLLQAKALEAPKRAYFRITSRGQDLLKQGHQKIGVKLLNQFPEFVEFHTVKAQKGVTTEISLEPLGETPEESLQKAHQSIRNDLAAQILDKIKANSPSFFERLVVDLMVAMNYGGSKADASKSVTGGTGDEGIDGIIKEDRLGLDAIYLQAKRWEGTVGRPEVQKFVGALHGKRAKKGVFITTGKFSSDAISYVDTIDPKVVLIDGRSLAELMIDYELGTTTRFIYKVQEMQSDYFTEE